MKEKPEGVDEAEVISAVADGWAIGIGSVKYLPLGAGSYHWVMVDEAERSWFVTVDDLGSGSAGGDVREGARTRLESAFRTALVLRRDAGLRFVVAPLPTRAGTMVHLVTLRQAVSIRPMVDGEAGLFGVHRAQDLPEVVELLADLHAATAVAAAGAPRTDLSLPGRSGLEEALDALDNPWPGGPHSEPARSLLLTHAGYVRELLASMDALVGRVRSTAPAWVVTHGEPHPGNLVRSRAGLRLIDWDTVQLAPPERDLWMVAAGSTDVLRSYTRRTGRTVSPDALALYDVAWKLKNIAAYVGAFRRPHRVTGDTRRSWQFLSRYLCDRGAALP
ncbi:phosphotransferase family protein [Streptomyces virginiae]|uniref:phosphotransferase family protein n=1 Tax=Streptomyces virginiae TaxID=1961 RepID=UPI0035DF4DAC